MLLWLAHHAVTAFGPPPDEDVEVVAVAMVDDVLVVPPPAPEECPLPALLPHADARSMAPAAPVKHPKRKAQLGIGISIGARSVTSTGAPTDRP
jgi:hypothetical protein